MKGGEREAATCLSARKAERAVWLEVLAERAGAQ